LVKCGDEFSWQGVDKDSDIAGSQGTIRESWGSEKSLKIILFDLPQHHHHILEKSCSKVFIEAFECVSTHTFRVYLSSVCDEDNGRKVWNSTHMPPYTIKVSILTAILQKLENYALLAITSRTICITVFRMHK